MPPHLSLQQCLGTIEGMITLEFQAKVKAARKARTKHKHAKFLQQGQEPWGAICSDVPTLEALHIVGSAILCSDSGFIGLETASNLVEHIYGGHNSECPWLSRKSIVSRKLLKYLPVVSVQLDSNKSGKATSINLAARPIEGGQMLQQLTTLASIANESASETEATLRRLPIKDFLRVMDSERDRRVFKGVITAVTSPTFVQSAFGWQSGSIATISEDLGLVGCYLSDLHLLLQSVEYCCTSSLAVRKRMRREALLRLSLNGFLGKKRGGRPSLIQKYS